MRRHRKPIIALIFLWITTLWHSQASAGLFNAKTFTLKNGLTVYVIENHRSPLVSQILCYKIGSADDPLGKSGLAHYLEHMMFKGPEGSASASIMAFVDNIGGAINAMTWLDWTIYYEVVPKEHFEKIMQLESERMKDLKILPDQAIPELKVITEERHMRIGNDPFGQFHIDLDAAFFRHHPYKNPPIGWENEILSYTPEDVKQQYSKWYAPNNALLVISGDITLEEAKKLVEKYYGPIPAKKLPARKRVVEPPFTNKVIVQTQTDKIDLPYVIFMWHAPNHHTRPTQKTTFALEVLSHALGGSMNSYLYRKLIEDKKVASSVVAYFQDSSLDPHDFRIQAQVSSTATLAQLESSLHEELQTLLKNGLTQAQVEKAKKHLVADLDYLRDSLLSGADHLAQNLSVGVSLDEMENWPDYIKEITVEDVNNAMRLVMDTNSYVIGQLTPSKKSLPDQPHKANSQEAQ